MFTHHRSADERGAIVVLSAFALMALVAIAAIVVDLSASRNDRSSSQIGVDAAAAAAGLELGTDGPIEACQTAFAYLSANLGEPLTGFDCNAMSSDCESWSSPVQVVGSAAGLTATVVHPVTDGNVYMGGSAAGSPAVPLSSADGEPCERIAVGIQRDRQLFFGGFLGAADSSTSVHAVSLAAVSESSGRPVHLLMLNRTDCDVINVNGGGSGGGLYVRATTDPLTGEIHPGFIASDSNGTTGCTSKGVLNVNGSGATIQADGAPGCADELWAGSGAGCGMIEIFAASGSGCSMPACSSSGQIDPPPSSLPRRITRAPVDHRYNCKSSYTIDIAGCGEASQTNPWIDQLESELGGLYPPIGYQDYVSEGHPCSIGGGPSTSVTIPEGNWWIDCSDLNVKRELIFEGGNIVLTGDLTVLANGTLHINAANTEVYDWAAGEAFDAYENSAQAGVLVLQSGNFKKAGGADVRIDNTAIYLGDEAELNFTGGNGQMIWTAPTEGPFEDLALWSNSEESHKFAGSSSLQMTGVFFAPHAEVEYQGNGSSHAVQAQFIADKLEMGGNGGLELNPEFDRMILFADDASSGLIR